MSRTIGYLTIDPKGRTTLPQEMRKQLGVSEGIQLRIDVTDTGSFEIVPSVSVPLDQLYYHSPEGRARLERAEEDFRLGRATRTSGEEETQRFLDSLNPGVTSKSGVTSKPSATTTDAKSR